MAALVAHCPCRHDEYPDGDRGEKAHTREVDYDLSLAADDNAKGHVDLARALNVERPSQLDPQDVSRQLELLHLHCSLSRVIRLNSCVLPPTIDSSSADWQRDRKSTRLNSSHLGISYAVFCL